MAVFILELMKFYFTDSLQKNQINSVSLLNGFGRKCTVSWSDLDMLSSLVLYSCISL